MVAHHLAPTAAHSASAPVAESSATQAARTFLALVDAGNWQDSYAAWGEHFHSVNSFEAWRSASVGGRVPLGRVLSRRLLGEEEIPVPPAGNQLVRFQTEFATKPHATERLTLVQEGGSWKIVGYTID